MIDQHPARSPIIDAAIQHITRDNWTILVVGNDKRPIGQWAPNCDNRYDYKNTERLYQLGNVTGIGVITGPSGLVIIDLDNEDAIRAWAERFGTPTTRIARTPRGRHLYYNAPPGIHIPPGTEIMPGVDVRGSESYAIIPPSILAGRAYTWVNQNPIQDLPTPIVELLSTAKQERKHHITSGAAFIEGGRNDHLTSMAGGMRRTGFNHSSILAALLEENKIRCAPPLAPSEVENIADSIVRYPAGELPGVDLIASLRAQTASHDDDDAPILLDRIHKLDTHHLVTQDAKPIDWIWEDFLAPGTLNMLHGEGGLGKSFLALKIAEQLLNPKPAPIFDRAVKRGGVIILDGENAESQLHRRIHNTTIRENAPLSIYTINDPILGLAEFTEQLLDHLVQEDAPSLVIIDSQRALWAGDEKEQAEAGRMLRAFARYVENHPCAYLVIHHDNRGGDYSGSSDINAAITGCRIHLTRHHDKDKPNARILTQPKNRIASEVHRQEFLLDITEQVRTHRQLVSGITLTPYVSTQTSNTIQRADQIITRLANPGTRNVTYRDAWASFGWKFDAKGLSSTHEPEWGLLKRELEERGCILDKDGTVGVIRLVEAVL
jgi:hypothetical protein